jgi:hypothetical protein
VWTAEFEGQGIRVNCWNYCWHQVVVESDSDAARATAFVMVDVTMGATEKACDYDACGYRG